ncbi:ATP-binding cassette domain-containing protein [Candidatus Peregrinibacteria bacterium]|nr:ATP-binding cassette domain-containing protein [Candidatus Peregrinibacteria bacterium]
MIAFSRVTKTYGKTVALSDVTFTVSPKECVCITGPAKAGKSTIIRLLLRAEVPSQGSISIDNVDLQLVPPPVLRLYRQRIGLKLAEGNLFLRKTVAENLTFPLALRALSERDASRAVRSMMERLGLLAHADLRPPHLSTEARTLLGLGRALIAHPMILLLDEPFADLSLDAFTLAASLLAAAHRSGATVICFSRDESIASALSARHIRIAAGKIIDDNPPRSTVASSPLSSEIHNILARVLLPCHNRPAKEKETRNVEVVAS